MTNNLESGICQMTGEELTKLLREKYDRCYADGYNAAIQELTSKGPDPNKLGELKGKGGTKDK